MAVVAVVVAELLVAKEVVLLTELTTEAVSSSALAALAAFKQRPHDGFSPL